MLRHLDWNNENLSNITVFRHTFGHVRQDFENSIKIPSAFIIFKMYKMWVWLWINLWIKSLQGRIYYESVGDYPAQSFFRVQNTSGAINVIQDLRQDNLRLSSYLVRIRNILSGLLLGVFVQSSRKLVRFHKPYKLWHVYIYRKL